MRRVGNLWSTLTTWENLATAVYRAARTKRYRPDVARFLLNWETATVELQRELRAGSYQPGPYRVFPIREPKPRQLSAAPFRDRVVHHALTQILEPIFEPRFTAQSYACRKGFGTHRAIRRAAIACSQSSHVLKCDIRKYFASVDHEILLDQLGRGIKCGPTLRLANEIIRAFNPQERVDHYFPGDDLFTPGQRRRGLPLGNQTSQFFANLYLNGLDHFILRKIQPSAYVRYVDDFLLFDSSAARLQEGRSQLEAELEKLRLRFHEGKSRVYRTVDGVTFLGWRLLPGYRRLVRGNVVRFRRRIAKLQKVFAAGSTDWEMVQQCLQAWNAHASNGDTWRLRTQIFEQFPFQRTLF